MTQSPPSGRPSREVYARRRAVVVGALVLIIFLIMLFAWRPWAGSSVEADPGATPSAPATTPSPGTTPSPTRTAGSACEPEDIKVTAITDKSTYAAGEKPQLKLSIRNTSAVACALGVGTGAQTFTVSSGGEKYWTSTDCQREPSEQTAQIEPGKEITSAAPIVWDRTRSDPETCEGAREAAPAAGSSYHLTVSIDGIESANTAQFILN